MASVLLRSGATAGSTTVSNEWWPIAANTLNVRNTPETVRQIVHRTAGTLSKFSATVTAATANRTLSVRINGSAVNQSISVSNGTTGVYSDAVNTDAVAAGDLLSYGASGVNNTISQWSCVFSPSSGTVQRISATFVGISATTNAPAYGGLSAGMGDGSIANAQWKAKTAGTWSNLAVHVRTNTRNGDVTIASRLNGGADGALTATITATTTGTFEDTSNSVAVAADDLACWHCTVAGSSGTCTIDSFSSDYATTTNDSMIGMYGDSGAFAANITRYLPAGGNIAANGYTTEADAQGPIGFACTASKLLTRVTTNGVTADSTVALRVGGSTSALTVTVPNATSGIFENTSSSVVLSSSDLINWIVTTGATGTSFGSLRTIQMQVAVGGRTALNTRSWPLGTEIGMGWRMPT